MANPRVYLDIMIDGEEAGRMTMELNVGLFPRTAENFRALCTDEKGTGKSGRPLWFKGSRFFLVKPGCWCCGGDIVENDGSCGESIYGEDFRSEGFNDFTGAGDLAMGYVDGVHSSQLFITFAKIRSLKRRYAVFGECRGRVGCAQTNRGGGGSRWSSEEGGSDF